MRDLVRILDKDTKVWLFFMNLFSHSCHQIPERSFFIKSYQFPICARCTGLYLGYIIALIGLIKSKKIFNFKASIVFIVVMAVDGLGQLFKFFESNNSRRFITGFLSGLATISLLKIFLSTTKKTPQR
ncbi:MAG: DUF2085 domain-containing protein [bacterium]